MDAKLLALQKQFKGQKASVEAGGGGFDNTPIPEGVYTAKIVDGKVKTVKRKGVEVPVFYVMLNIQHGDQEGKKCWPFAPDLSQPDGIIAAAKTVRTVLGVEKLPGKITPDNQFDLQLDQFLGNAEEFAHSLIGQVVEIRVANSNQTRDDGTPFQNIWINRALGLDAAAAEKAGTKGSAPEKHEGTSDLGLTRKAPARKKARG